MGLKVQAADQVAMQRLYNSNTREHFYTASASERGHLVNVGWQNEGIGWFSDDNETVTVYREYNPNTVAGAHNFTTSSSEDSSLGSHGWKQEGTAWYAVAVGKSVQQDLSVQDVSDYYASISADMTLKGSGTGYHAKILIRTNNTSYNTASFGIQYDSRMDSTKDPRKPYCLPAGKCCGQRNA